MLMVAIFYHAQRSALNGTCKSSPREGVCDNLPSPLPYYTFIIFMTHACAVPSAYDIFATHQPSVSSPRSRLEVTLVTIIYTLSACDDCCTYHSWVLWHNFYNNNSAVSPKFDAWIQASGVERARVNLLMNTLHAHAITSLHTIVKLRRELERSPTNRRRH